MTIRAFIAIELPAGVQEVLGRTGLQLAADISHGAVRWVKPANIHLTLKFLGDIQENSIPQIGLEIGQATQGLQAFTLKLDKVGCFPNPRRPRIIWVGVGGELDRLDYLYNGIERALGNCGWEPEKRPFHPHLTIGRVKNQQAVVRANLPFGRAVTAPPFSVKSVSLIESVLKPTGAVYTSRFRNRFGSS